MGKWRMAPFAIGLAAAALLLSAGGCSLGSPPDPNDPEAVGELQPEVIQRNLARAANALQERVLRGELNDQERNEYLTHYAEKLTQSVDVARIKPEQAWRYADAFRTARMWDRAIPIYETALEWARRENDVDRVVNDSLRLAQCLAHTGKAKEAIELARGTFEVAPKDKAPILMSVLYEIVPPLEGKSVDRELAQLVEEAIGQHLQVVVDVDSPSGQAFVGAKVIHVRKAWQKVIELYQAAGDDLAAKNAAERADQALSHQAVL